MKERGGPLARFLDLHTLLYEEQKYPDYTPITKQDAKKNCPLIWRWIDATMPTATPDALLHGVKECFFVLFGERHYPTVVTHTICDHEGQEQSTFAHEVPEGVDPAAILKGWIRHESPIPDIDLRPTAENKVVAFYLLYQSEDKVERLSEFLSRPSFIVSDDSLIGQSGKARTVEEILSRPPGQKYYQRLCVIFGCVDEASALRLRPLAKQIICGLITTWGGALERANERARAAEMEALAWSHEVGNFIRYLDWEEKNTSRHLYDLTINFLEVGTMATVKTKNLPDVISLWPRLKTDQMLSQACDLGARFAVLREYRGSHEAIKTIPGLEGEVDSFKVRFAEPEIAGGRLRLAGGRTHPELNQKLKAFAQFLIFSLYSAARHSREQGSIQVRLSRDRITIKNPLPDLVAGGTPKSEVRAILHQAFQVLWDNTREDFICEPVNGFWTTDCPLPESLWEKGDEKADRLLH